MSDLPQNDVGWRVLPQDYLVRRPAAYSSSRRPDSCYVAMPDGVRLAVDVYLPSDAGAAEFAGRLPALVIFTPYYRRF
ncbi:MAG: hydrolase, partial [Betaproteobacteria bacterium]